MNNVQILLDSSRGIYIPKIFAESFKHELIDGEGWEGVCIQCLDELRDINGDCYWEAWEEALATAYYVDSNGKTWTLWQDGDLFAIAYDEMSDNEKLEFFGEI